MCMGTPVHYEQTIREPPYLNADGARSGEHVEPAGSRREGGVAAAADEAHDHVEGGAPHLGAYTRPLLNST